MLASARQILHERVASSDISFPYRLVCATDGVLQLAGSEDAVVVHRTLRAGCSAQSNKLRICRVGCRKILHISWRVISRQRTIDRIFDFTDSRSQLPLIE
jgi:hypothetical protein